MIITAVRFQNFRTFGNELTEVRLDASPTTLVVGSNGAGKSSSLLETICFGLFGKPFNSKINKGQLVNSITKKGLLVEVDFVSGGKSYTIFRGIKPNMLDVTENGSMLRALPDVREYQDWIEKNILRMNVQTFRQIVVLGKDTHVPFMRLPALERRKVVEDILDIEVFTIMNKVLKERTDEHEKSTADVMSKLAVAEVKLRTIERAVEARRVDVDQQIADKTLLRNEHRLKYNRQRKIAEELEAEARKLAVQADELADVDDMIRELYAVKSKLALKRDEAAEQHEFYCDNDVCPTCTQRIDAGTKDHRLRHEKERIDLIDARMGKVMEKETELLERQALQKKLSADISKLNRQIFEAQQTATMCLDAISQHDLEIENLKAKGQQAVNDEDLSSAAMDFHAISGVRDSLAADKRLLEAAKKMLKDEGVKAAIIREYVPVMNQMINRYLGDLDLFVDFHLDENFNEFIRSRHRDDFTYEMFSAGEKLRIDIAILFAWRAIAKMRTGAAINLLVLDEILDSSLDEAGVDDFLRVVQELTGGQNVFIISHRREQLADKFTRVLRFAKRNNFSKLEEIA